MTATLPTTEVHDLLRVSDLNATQVALLLDLAALMQEERADFVDALPGELLTCYFEKPSTRTRVSFAGAAARLGMTPLLLRRDELQLGRGELLSDTARVLSSYSAAIVARVFDQTTLEELAKYADVPVVNALSDEHHPCQALADLLTIRDRFGGLSGVRVAFVGDGNNVTHSLLEAGARAGMHLTVASPPGFDADLNVALSARATAATTGGGVLLRHDPRDAVRGADVVYTDVWTSMGDESEHDARTAAMRPYAITPELMRLASPHAIFMHCLPAHRGEEVAAEVIDGPQSAVWEQAANRLPTAEAVLFALILGWDAAARRIG